MEKLQSDSYRKIHFFVLSKGKKNKSIDGITQAWNYFK